MARARSYAAVGFPRTHIVMDPTPEQLRHDLLLLEQKMGDYNLPLQRSKQIIIGGVSEAFIKEKDPIGTKWVSLSESAKKVPRLGMLRREKTNAKMWRDMTNRYNYGVSKEGVYLNQSRIVKYMPYHQQDERGSSGNDVLRVPKAKVIAMRNKRFMELMGTRQYEHFTPRERRATLLAQAGKEVSDSLRKEQGKGSFIADMAGDGKIPRRRFLAIDEGRQMEIRKTMDLWAKDVIMIYKRGKNVIQAPRRGLK